eukprot:3941435-Rhodomonas_salina.1
MSVLGSAQRVRRLMTPYARSVPGSPQRVRRLMTPYAITGDRVAYLFGAVGMLEALYQRLSSYAESVPDSA